LISGGISDGGGTPMGNFSQSGNSLEKFYRWGCNPTIGRKVPGRGNPLPAYRPSGLPHFSTPNYAAEVPVLLTQFDSGDFYSMGGRIIHLLFQRHFYGHPRAKTRIWGKCRLSHPPTSANFWSSVT